MLDFVSAKDLTALGIKSNSIGKSYQIFGAGTIMWVGQCVGMVVADSLAHAQRAAKAVVQTYTHDLSAEARASVAGACLAGVGASADMSADVSADMSAGAKVMDRETSACVDRTTTATATATVSGSVSTTGQKHFYMETQTCLAVPNATPAAVSGGQLEVHCSTQLIGLLQTMLSTCLNVPTSSVTVVNRHVGGAYGGKAFLHAPNAVATCAR